MKMDDGNDALLPLSPVCTFCKHLRSVADHTCDAFPKKNSIPVEIWQGDNPHLSPVDGDHGIQFEPIDESKAFDLERWEKKALKSLRRFHKADVAFESNAIPLPEQVAIHDALKAAATSADVRRAFKRDSVDSLLDDVDADARAWVEAISDER